MTALPRRSRCLLLAALLTTCSARQEPAAPRLEVPHVFVEGALLAEALELTRALIQSRPVNPPGKEARAAELLAERLRLEGIEVELDPFDGEARKNLLARLPGRAGASLPPVLLFAHLDVVPADEAEWDPRAPPFAALVRCDHLVGRGALDMLSMAALETLALVALKRADLPLERDVLLLLTGDEEVSGLGMRRALLRWPEVGQAAFALTEGSFLLEDVLVAGEEVVGISVAERGVFQFRLTARGPSAHASSPPPKTATRRLLSALSRFFSAERPLRFPDETRRMLAALGEARGGLWELALKNPELLKAVGQSALEASPKSAALVRDTCALTVLEGGYKTNVIPAIARATVDCRLLPGTSPKAFYDDVLRRIGDPRIEIEVIEAAPASGSPPEGPVIDAIRERMRRELPDVAVIPVLTPGTTDSRHLRPLGVHAYGFVPMRVNAEELDSIHGKDERVRVAELERGLLRLVDITAALARAIE